MTRTSNRPDQPVRARILLHALIGVLAITAAFVLSGETGGQRTGALLLLMGGMLFVTVVIVDSARALRGRTGSKPTNPRPRHPLVTTQSADRTVRRRIQQPRPEPHTRS